MLTTVLALILDTLTLGWRDIEGWRFWYGAGASLTFVVMVLRIAPAARRFFRDTQWSGPAVLMGTLVCIVGPLTVVALSTFVWPALLAWMMWSSVRAN